jgi:hypothetical protein
VMANTFKMRHYNGKKCNLLSTNTSGHLRVFVVTP